MLLGKQPSLLLQQNVLTGERKTPHTGIVSRNVSPESQLDAEAIQWR